MHRRKVLFPFVGELLLLLFVITVILVGFSVQGLITVHIQLHWLVVVAGILVILIAGKYISRIMNWGTRALGDMLFPKDITLQGVFLEQNALQASMLANTRTKEGIARIKSYYLIQVIAEEKTMTLLSPNYLPLKQGREYSFLVAARSDIVIDYHEIE